MNNKREDIKKELKELVLHGRFLTYHEALANDKLTKGQKAEFMKNADFKEFVKSITSSKSCYQTWYSKSCQVIKQLLPDRLEEFRKLYLNEKRVDKDITYLTYSISDYFLGLRITSRWEEEDVVNAFNAFYSKMELQIEIVNSCLKSIDSKLLDIESILQSELFDTELETAKDILKKKHIRLAGALAGITLEAHLKKVCQNHKLPFKKQNPTISDFNEELKKTDIIDIPIWRLVQRLGDIRNLCVHSKEREPRIDEVQDLISGTEKLIAELY
jgi:hypothetical protein